MAVYWVILWVGVNGHYVIVEFDNKLYYVSLVLQITVFYLFLNETIVKLC